MLTTLAQYNLLSIYLQVKLMKKELPKLNKYKGEKGVI